MDIIYSKTYRYEFLRCNSKSNKVLYVLHGYGQLANFFIRKFEILREKYHIIAPEGMHRFYLNGTTNQYSNS